MKKILISLALVSMTFAWAQKKEISEAVTAVESNDMVTAKARIAAIDSQIGDKTYLLEPELLEQYYYVKGITLFQSGKKLEGATMLGKIKDLAKSKIYRGKDADKNKVYFVGKTAADASGISGLKEEVYTPTTLTKLGALINPILQKSNSDAINAYNNKKYLEAGNQFREVYTLLNTVGDGNQQYLYNAALSYTYAEDYPKAIEVFEELIKNGYTGVTTNYTAKNKETGEVTGGFSKETWELAKKDPKYSDFKAEQTPSVEKDIYESLARIQIQEDKYNDALSTIEKGLKKFPNNSILTELRGTAYFKSGKTDDFISNLKSQLAKNPNDAVSWYNLGVMQSKNPATLDEAVSSFQKSIDLKPTKDAYQNIVYALMGDDQKTIDSYQELKKAGKIEEANKVMENRKNRFAKAIPYAEKWYEFDTQDIDTVSLLKAFYQTTRNEAKYKEFKAKEEALKK